MKDFRSHGYGFKSDINNGYGSELNNFGGNKYDKFLENFRVRSLFMRCYTGPGLFERGCFL